MPRNTGRGSPSATNWPARPWSDVGPPRTFEIWTEPEGVAIYHGPKATAQTRQLLTRRQALAMAWTLVKAALR